MNKPTEIKTLLDKAWTLRSEGRYDEALRLITEAQGLCKDDDYDYLGRVFHVFMQLEADRNNISEAVELCQKSLAYYKKAGHPQKIAHSTRHIADLEFRQGRFKEAEQNYRTAIGLCRGLQSPNPGNLANALRGLGILLEKLNKTEESISVWRETKSLYAACQLEAGVDEADDHLDALAKLTPPK